MENIYWIYHRIDINMKSVKRLRKKYINNIYRKYSTIKIIKNEYYKSIADYYRLYDNNNREHINYLIKSIYSIVKIYASNDETIYDIVIKSVILLNYIDDDIKMNNRTIINAAICTYICLIIELDTQVKFVDIRNSTKILQRIGIIRYILELIKILSAIRYNIYRFYNKYKLDILEIYIS